jgi:hypothetical protein
MDFKFTTILIKIKINLVSFIYHGLCHGGLKTGSSG